MGVRLRSVTNVEASRTLGGLAVGLPASLLSGCGAGPGGDVHVVVLQFQEALAGKDGAGACALLSPSAQDELTSSTGKSCENAVTKELSGLPGPFDVAVYGPKAWANSGTHAMFLARYAVG